MTDDQTVENLRVMPQTRAAIFDAGTEFRNSFVSFPYCCPSRATFLTGQYSHNNDVWDNGPPFGGFGRLDHSNTLPVWLQAAGYHTTLIGKYLNGNGAFPDALVPAGWSDYQGLVGGSTYRMYGYRINDNGRIVRYASAPGDYQTDVLSRRALATIDERAEAGQPFFMWITPLAPHFETPTASDPLPRGPRAAPRHEGRFADEALFSSPAFNEADVSDKPTLIRARKPLTPQQQANVLTDYRERLESLLAVDDMVGAITAKLEALGLLDQTYLIFTSDNGFFHGEHRFEFGKVRLYEASVRVPLGIRGPAFAVGSVSDALVANVDLAGTIARLAGATPRRVLDGLALDRVVAEPGIAANRAVLLENFEARVGKVYNDAIRTERYKYVEWRSPSGSSVEAELYDLVLDPDELENLVEVRAYAPVRNALRKRLAKLKVCAGPTCITNQAVPDPRR